jgi:outer membrane protein TolC
MSLLTLKPQWLFATIFGIGSHSLNAMVNPVATVRGRRHILPDFPAWIAVTVTKACLVIMLFAAISLLTCYGPALGAEMRPAPQALTSANPLTFDESVKIAINQSPYFTKSSVQIDMLRMDETDRRYGMVPPLTFRTYYYLNRPENTGSRPYSLNFSMDPYNPFGSYYSLQAQKVATQMAILSHLQGISKGLERLGAFYLGQENLRKRVAYQKAKIDLDREILTYAENRFSIGTGTSLDVKVAQQELQLAQNELEQLGLTEKRNLANIKRFLGLPPSAEFNPDLHNCQRQVLGDFNPATATVEQAKNHSYEMKIIDLQRKLQGFKVLMAKAKVMPNILFVTQTPDPLNASNGNGLYASVGLEIPVWDGFQRIRDISRQKAVLKQVDATKEEKTGALEDSWSERKDSLQSKSVALKMAQSQEELVRLQARQTEVRYQSGGLTLPDLLESRKQVLEAQKGTLNLGLEYDLGVLKLRELSGDLGNTYVNPNSWQK